MMRVMGDGVLAFECPLCNELLEVGVHVVTVAADPTIKVSPLTKTHYGHRVEFIAEAPNLHAEFWGHLVREHQPDPHPYCKPVRVERRVPAREFVDDLGRRWEWCGGTDDTWAWRITALPDDDEQVQAMNMPGSDDSGLSMWEREYDRIQEQAQEEAP